MKADNCSFKYNHPAKSKSRPGFNYSERHLQCVWYSPDLRPPCLHTIDGETVRVEKPGYWNLEKGPDFINATLLVGAEKRRMTGDVEIHVHPEDWRLHGHSSDPVYARVVAHVSYFPAHLPPAVLPPGVLQIPLKQSLLANPFFSFESIDVASFPYALRRPLTPCSRVISTWPPEKSSSLLSAAGKYRLERKAARLASAASQKGEEQTLYEEIMNALGYKHNSIPFRLLAEKVPLVILRENSAGDCTAAYALLAGVAGLLPAVTKVRWDAETRKFVQRLWSSWWKQQARWSSVAMPLSAWRLSSLRPHNHPRRRLMAAAVLFTDKKSLHDIINRVPCDNAAQWLSQIMDIFLGLNDRLAAAGAAYWNNRLAIGRKPSADDIALVGRQRASAIISNVIIPFQLGLHRPLPPLEHLLSSLPDEENNAVIKQSAINLFGPDHGRALYRQGLLQQGLIQIFHDYCLNDRSNCADCELLKMIRKG
jgi:hypothetical protein